MKPDNYAPPQAEVGVPSRGKPAPVRGIILGLLVDIGGSILSSTLISVVIAVVLTRAHKTPQEIQQLLTHIEPFTSYWLIMMTGGMLCSFLGGYVCALNAKVNVMRTTAIFAAITTTLGIVLSSGRATLLEHLVLGILSVVVVMSGGYLWLRTHR